MFTTVSISKQSMGRFGGKPKSYFAWLFFSFVLLFGLLVCFHFRGPSGRFAIDTYRVTVPQMAFKRFRTGLESQNLRLFFVVVGCCLHFVWFRSSIDTILPFGSLDPTDRIDRGGDGLGDYLLYYFPINSPGPARPGCSECYGCCHKP